MIWRVILTEHIILSPVSLPVCVGHLEILDRVRLDVDSKVGEMAETVNHTKDEDKNTNNFVKIDVVIKGQVSTKAFISEECDGVPENKCDDDNR